MSKNNQLNFSSFSSPEEALDAFLARLSPVETENIAWEESCGRVLAEPLLADRASPACDVSAMDGYAIRLKDLKAAKMPVAGEIAIGEAPPELPENAVLRIVTGAPVPPGTEAVIKREDCEEKPNEVRFLDSKPVTEGLNIRRQGENIERGGEVLSAGVAIDPPTLAALSAFGVARPRVHRRLRVGIIITGNEVLKAQEQAEPWQLRDSNGPALWALLSNCPWIEPLPIAYATDRFEEIESALRKALESCDAVFLTGGVSAGDYDYVPDVVRAVGAELLFHKLPIRPGKPILGAVMPSAQAILALPGNPVAVQVAARRFGEVVLRKMAGFRAVQSEPPLVMLDEIPKKTLGLWWYRPVRLLSEGRAALVPSRGSGDLVAATRADGFIETPPDASAAGPWPFYPWML